MRSCRINAGTGSYAPRIQIPDLRHSSARPGINDVISKSIPKMTSPFSGMSQGHAQLMLSCTSRPRARTTGHSHLSTIRQMTYGSIRSTRFWNKVAPLASCRTPIKIDIEAFESDLFTRNIE